MYICMYVCTYVCMHACMYACVYIYTHMYINIQCLYKISPVLRSCIVTSLMHFAYFRLKLAPLHLSFLKATCEAFKRCEGPCNHAPSVLPRRVVLRCASF